jgi:glycosyltransferase involved in cell wall biosynthesis/SAM-dependent methyltransferase
LNRDGTIQEAGWRILANGWGHPIGRGGDPRDGSYTYRRAVDCVTGACFAMPRTVFEELGGFDPLYAPAFYEEFDLAFRARVRGLLAIYEPRSHVLHLGSASYGAERRDKLSDRNHAKFCERFIEILRKQPWDTVDEFALRHASGAGPVLLVVDESVPQPDRHAGEVTMSRYVSMLATAGWRVVFGPMNGWADGPAAEALERQGIELIRSPRTIEEWLAEHGAHVREVWLARPKIAERMIDPVRAHTRARITYYTHDLHHLRLLREAEVRRDLRLQVEAFRLQEQECNVFRNVDCVISPSEEEAQVIRELVPGTPAAVLPPYYYETAEIRERNAAHFAALSDIVFVGGFPHTPNVDAALYIVQEVMPLVWCQLPDVRIILVGYAPPPEIRALAGPRVQVTGQVPELTPYVDRARLMLAALRYGAGVKGKIVEAMRFGVPVVTTPVGAEGIGIMANRDAVVAEDAVGLAIGVLELLRDPDRCAALSAAGAELVARRFSRRAARLAIEAVFQTPRCAVCGSAELDAPPTEGNFREAFVCRNCFALGRTEALARVMLARIAQDGECSLAELARRKPELRVHEFGFVGGVAETLRGQHWFTVSEYFEDVPLGNAGPGGVHCEDLARLTFADNTFDLVISQDVIEHVPDPRQAFAETARVLRPGGAHIFTIPHSPELTRSVTRAKLGANGVEYILPPEHHGDPLRAEGALVFTDFGADLGAILEDVGLHLIEHDLPVLGGGPEQLIRVFEALRPAACGKMPRYCPSSKRMITADFPKFEPVRAELLHDLEDSSISSRL